MKHGGGYVKVRMRRFEVLGFVWMKIGWKRRMIEERVQEAMI